jgi:signal transduction histidine kinase/HAMP domain-containing protein
MSAPASIAADAPRPRRRLFWKYVAVIVVLVTTLLVASGGVELWFSYQESRDALVALQREKAAAAAGRIEAFIREIERQMGWTTLPLLASGAAALEQRRIDFVRLQRQVQPITDLQYLDAVGKEQLRISRLAMDVVGSGIDFASDPRFTQAVARKIYHGPVYFRKESEPYMVVAMLQSGGGVTVAEVNLKFIWDVVTQIKIGKAGRAYVVDEAGNLIAHPDISLVLQKTSLSTLPQVRQALVPDGPETPTARDVQGRRVLTAHATIPGLRWTVFAEQPLEEALAPIEASLKRSLALLAVGVALAIGASLVLARRMVRPIQALQTGAARIGGGDLGHRIEVRTGDELQALATDFNRMTGTLQESYATLEQRVVERTKELSEALERQNATGEILRVISSSPTNIQPVLDAVAESSARLCEATDAIIQLRETDNHLRIAAHFGSIPTIVRVGGRRPLTRDWVSGRCVIDARAIHVDDLQALTDEYPEGSAIARAAGHRTLLAMPLLREGEAIGAILVRRPEVRPFSEKHVTLLQTFADQAVIAIENVRLFTELQQRNAEVTESLEQQTATSEILRVISSSPTDAQPVFDTIIQNAVRLSGAMWGSVFRVEDGLVNIVAHENLSVEERERVQRLWPQPVGTTGPVARVASTGQVLRIHDLEAEDTGFRPESIAEFRARGVRSMVVVPMSRHGRVIGSINLSHQAVGAFSDAHVTLIRTFADQAVIAIENVRLFKELESRNAALSETLEQQTATAEILRVINAAQVDLQPVFEAIAASAARLCEGLTGGVFLVEDDRVLPAAHHNLPSEAFDGVFPASLDADLLTTRAIAERRVVHTPDILAESEYRHRELVERLGFRSALSVPMMREGTPVGAIIVTRAQPGAFTDKQIALLQTFADQAVIAIENVRLLQEVQARNAALTESLEQQTATAEILRVISQSPTDVQPVLEVVAKNAARVCGARDALVFRAEGDRLQPVAHFGYLPNSDADIPRPSTRTISPASVLGRAFLERRTVQVADMLAGDVAKEFSEGAQFARRMGHRTVMVTPLVREGVAIGAIAMRRDEVHPFSDKQIALLETFASQAVIAIENVRLFTELQERTSQLQVANRHKDEFLANMSHELRTPLNAIIGFSEVMLERMFGELTDKQEEYLNDILSSGRHLLSLINDILDLSKIEAGRMELDVADFNLPVAIDNALTLVHERAARRGLTLTQDVDERLGDFRGDERKIKQVLLNLLSNAIKFTPEGGKVQVRAELKGEVVEIAVADTGVGIAPEDQEMVFEEFRQVGTDVAKKHEGTGLGLALSRRFVELHGGNLWLESEVGVGSTFTFALPVRRD